MFVKSSALFSLLALAIQASAHAIITPALGVTGIPARSDVTRPSTNAPCGDGVNVASDVSTAQSVAAAADGSFTVSVTNFNAGKDGSTAIASSQIDTTATGKSFNGGAVTITKNGVQAPTSTGTVQVSGSLPAGTTCTGGASGNACLVSLTTAGGFGNCVLVSQGQGAAAGTGAAAGNGTAANATGATAGTGTAATGTGAAAGGNGATTSAKGTTGTTTTSNGKAKNAAAKNAAKAKASGARLARALKIRKALGESLEQKREIGWMWAPDA